MEPNLILSPATVLKEYLISEVLPHTIKYLVEEGTFKFNFQQKFQHARYIIRPFIADVLNRGAYAGQKLAGQQGYQNR